VKYIPELLGLLDLSINGILENRLNGLTGKCLKCVDVIKGHA